MKLAPRYYTKNPNKVMAYQEDDLKKLKLEIDTAKQIWYDTWQNRGSEDMGSCCGGKGISIPYIRKGKRIAEDINVVQCGWVQGNVSASQAVGKALVYIKQFFPDAVYNDGWMD